MSGSSWERIEGLFHDALEQPAEARIDWLRTACGGDEAVFQRVLELVEADAAEDDAIGASVDHGMERLGQPAATGRGRILGAWRVLEPLGAGGMGSVFLAERDDDEYDRKVAIKLIRGFPDPASLQRLRDERQILANLNHPNIAAMIDGGTTDDGQPYLVMEYVEGQPIDAWCAAHAVPLRRRVELVRKLCAAVHHAHQNLVIHRDLKPENALVTEDGRPVLLDFGIAKLLEADAGENAGPTRSARFYTPGYSAPEQLRGEPVSTATDVYSMGRLLEALLEDAPGDVPSDLRAVVECATAELPTERYASMAALDEELGRFLAGLPVAAASGRWRYRARKFVARYRWPIAALFAALALAAGLVREIVLESERAHAAEQRALVEAAHANQVLEFLIGMIESAEPGGESGRELRVLDVLERARGQGMAERVEDDAVRGRILFAIGRLYRVLELFEPARALLTEAAALAERSGDPELQVEALSVAGMSAVLAERIDEARPLLEQAVAIARSTPELDPLTRASAINNFGVFLNEADDFEGAFEMVTEALSIRRAAGAPPQSIATSLHNLGEIADLRGDPGQALEHYREALALKRDSIGRMHPSYARSLNGIAMNARQVGEYEVARAALEEQLEIRLELFGSEHPGLTRDYNELAIYHHDMGQFAEAIANYERAMAYDAMNPGGAPSDWLLTNNIGAAYRDWGQPERAIELFGESIRLRTERFGPDNGSTLRARHNLASALYAAGRHAEAAVRVREVVALRVELLGDDHPDVARSRVLQLAVETALDPTADPAGREAAMAERIEALSERFSPEGGAVLAARRLRADMLLLRGALDRAAEEFAEVAGLYRSTLRDGHPLALTAELEGARIELLRGRSIPAERLEVLRTAVADAFAEASLPFRMLGCLERNRTESACWRAAAD